MSADPLSPQEIADLRARLLQESACPRCVGRFTRNEGPGSGWCAECAIFIETIEALDNLTDESGRLWRERAEEAERERSS